MFPHTIITKFGLIAQHQRSPDGYPIYIAEHLSNNNPTVFFEPYYAESPSAASKIQDGTSGRRFVRITKAGATDSITITMEELEALTFEEMQKKIESELHIPN